MPRSILVACGTYAVVGALFAFRETPLLQLLFGVSLLALFVAIVFSAIHVFRSWSQLRWRALLPLFMSGLVLIVSTQAGRFARDTYFRRQIPRLEVSAKAFHASGQLLDVPWSGYKVTASKIGDTNAAVTFWWGSGFPVKHTVLVYFSAADPKHYFKGGGWRRGYVLQDHWWVVKD